MRRKRILVAILGCVLSGGAWSLSYLVRRATIVETSTSAMVIRFGQGVLTLEYWSYPITREWRQIWLTAEFSTSWLPDIWCTEEYDYSRTLRMGRGTAVLIGRTSGCMLPLWIPFSFFVFVAFIQRCRWKSSEDGLCVGCGYNLRGNVTGVCPECARPIKSDRN